MITNVITIVPYLHEDLKSNYRVLTGHKLMVLLLFFLMCYILTFDYFLGNSVADFSATTFCVLSVFELDRTDVLAGVVVVVVVF